MNQFLTWLNSNSPDASSFFNFYAFSHIVANDYDESSRQTLKLEQQKRQSQKTANNYIKLTTTSKNKTGQIAELRQFVKTVHNANPFTISPKNNQFVLTARIGHVAEQLNIKLFQFDFFGEPFALTADSIQNSNLVIILSPSRRDQSRWEILMVRFRLRDEVYKTLPGHPEATDNGES